MLSYIMEARLSYFSLTFLTCTIRSVLFSKIRQHRLRRCNSHKEHNFRRGTKFYLEKETSYIQFIFNIPSSSDFLLIFQKLHFIDFRAKFVPRAI